MKNLLWELFKNTGKIQYYLKMKEVEKNERSKNRTNL